MEFRGSNALTFCLVPIALAPYCSIRFIDRLQ